MSDLKKLANHSSRYLSLRILSIAISMATFPIMTRLFSVSEYGIFALANTTIAIILAFSKFGFSTAFARDYPAYQHNKPNILYSTSFWLQLESASIITAGYLMVIFLLRNYFGELNTKIYLIIGPILVLRALQSLLFGFYRAEENIRSYNRISLVFKVAVSFFGIVCVMLSQEKIVGFFVGTLIVESAISIYLVYKRKNSFLFSDISWDLGVKLFKYGIPLIVFELSSLLLSMADRYQIQYYLGAEPLGIYSASYNLASYIQESITGPLWMAIFPIYTKIWQHEGSERTRVFLSTCLKYYFAIAIPAIFGIAVIGKDILLFFASKKYASASDILPWVLAGQLIHGMYHIVSAGIYLNQKTKHVAISTALCALLNLALNVVLIPKFGIVGAAYSTFIAYIILITIITADAFQSLPLKFPIKEIFIYTGFSTAMMLLMQLPIFSSILPRIIFMVLLGVVSYASMILIYDRRARLFVSGYLNIKINP